MWEDIGLGDWLFDMDKPDQVKNLNDAVLKIAQQPDWAKERVSKAHAIVRARQKVMCQALFQRFGW